MLQELKNNNYRRYHVWCLVSFYPVVAASIITCFTGFAKWRHQTTLCLVEFTRWRHQGEVAVCNCGLACYSGR